MNIAIVGSRTYPDLDAVRKAISNLPRHVGIVTGGARGVDKAAEDFALKHGHAVQVIRPDYKAFGKAAPIVRNQLIVKESDAVWAFWDGESRGTAYTIAYGLFLGKTVWVRDLDGMTVTADPVVDDPEKFDKMVRYRVGPAGMLRVPAEGRGRGES